MKLDILEVQPNDVLILSVDVGNVPLSETDNYIDKVMENLDDVFGCRIVAIPNRGNGTEFISVIRKTKSKEDYGYRD